MKNRLKLAQKISISTFLVLFIASLLPLPLLNYSQPKEAQAAAINLIANSSFEQDATNYWYLWQSASSSNFSLVRSYDVPFGYGSFAASIDATGDPKGRFDAGLVGANLNHFEVTQGKTYYFSFFAKASEDSKFSIYLENIASHKGVTPAQEIKVNKQWTNYLLVFTPDTSGQTVLSFAFGDLAKGSSIYFDGLNLYENNISLATTVVSGFVGDKNKSLVLTNGNLVPLSEIKIELPYFNDQTDTTSFKQFSPKSITNNTVYFDIPNQTFAGIGKVYVSGSLIGQFDYNVFVKINDFNPNPIRVDGDLVVYGSGFSPNNDQNFIVLNVTDTKGKISEKWIKPTIIDAQLSQVVIKVPAGIASGKISARTYHSNLKDASIENKSASLSYAVKPLIYSLDWSRKGYEQVGDKITILGKGIANHPVVSFYDENGKMISQTNAVVKTINETDNTESIEVVTPKLLNKLKVTVKIGNSESDKADALNYSARPILSTIKSSKSRSMPISGSTISAAKIGETIRLNGQGYKDSSALAVEFAGLNGNISVSISPNKIDPAGKWIDVVVPDLAQNGQVSVISNGERSNYVSLEIIPTIISQTPLNPTPGEEMSFWTNGVGLNKDLVTVHFTLDNKETISVAPSSLEKTEYGNVIVKVIAPKAIASKGSIIKIQYDNWLNDESYSLTASPVIERAGIDIDSKVLSIKGYGFSNVLAENKITYKYADGTVVTPKVKPLSITNTSEGQEIKIQILDDYYYGSVSVSVGDKISNEYNVGPTVITRVERRVQFVKTENRVMGVLYISGKNLGPKGDVKVGDVWAKTHYRSNFFIIAVVESNDINKNPVIVTKY